MTRTGGITRKGRKGRFRYYDRHGAEIVDPAKLERIEALRIPPAWRDVWISPRPGAKLQAVGVDSAGRRQYLYHPEYRARQEQAKYDKLIRFAERLPALRAAAAEHLERDDLSFECVCAVAVRLVNLAWFRVGSDRYAKASRTFGITTLRKRHVTIRGSRIAFRFRAKHNAQVRTAVVDAELAAHVRRLLTLDGDTRLFRYERDGEISALTDRKLNDYIRQHMGEEFSAKDFRTWGGTLLAAIAFAERELPEAERASSGRSSPRSCGASAGSSGIRLRLRALPTSAPPWSSSISTGVPSTISGRGICASFGRGSSTSTRRSRRCSRCCGRGEFARPGKQPDIRLHSGRSPIFLGGIRGSEDSAGLRQLREGSRRGKGRDPARHLFRRTTRREAGGSLRRVRRLDARPAGCPQGSSPQVGLRLGPSERPRRDGPVADAHSCSSRAKPRSFRAFPASGGSGPSGPGTTMGRLWV